MRNILFILLFTFCATAAYAIPARRVTKTVIVDGKATLLTLVGDETLHYWAAADGRSFQFENGEAVPFDLSSAQATYKARKRMTSQLAAASKSKAPSKTQYIGQQRGLVILVNFKDKEFSCTTTPKETYKEIVSGTDISIFGQNGSVRDYFKAQSYNKFDFLLDVAGPVTLSQKMSYYGANDSSGEDARPAQMVKEACQLANDEVDFSQYDWDGDGNVEHVFVVYAGYSEAQGGSADTVWPHAWTLKDGTGSALKLDGVTIDSYACGSELSGSYGKQMDGIGTFCHEFSHCFGLPDFYDTTGKISFTMQSWSLMDYGCYNNNGYCPCSYTAYERWFCGWLEPEELEDGRDIEGMGNLDDNGECYVIYNKANNNEYYLLQNIQQKGWNKYAAGHGMLVLHVDYNYNAWYNNTPNTVASHLRMSPVCADNKANASTMAGDPYPGTSKNTSLTDETIPATTLFNVNKDGRKYLGTPIEDIKESKGLISFTFNGGTPLPAPESLRVESRSSNVVSLTWDEVEGASHYVLEYGPYDPEAEEKKHTYLETAFEFDVEKDASTDIGSKLDEYLDVKGFTGSKLYMSPSGLKCGSSSANGYIITPAIDFENESAEMLIRITPYNASTTPSVKVSLLDTDDNVVGTTDAIQITEEHEELVFSQPMKGTYRLRVGVTKRAYLELLSVYVPSMIEGEPVTIDNIQSNHVTIEPDYVTSACYAKVLAVHPGGKKSAWTEKLIFPIDQESAVNKIEPAASGEAVIYSIDGRQVDAGNVRPGAYIVRQNGKSRCIIKK